MIKKLTALGLAGLMALFTGSASADGHALRVGVEGAYPPFSWKEADGTLKRLRHRLRHGSLQAP